MLRGNVGRRRKFIAMDKTDWTSRNNILSNWDDSSTYDGNSYNDYDDKMNELSFMVRRKIIRDAWMMYLNSQYPYWRKPILHKTYCNKIIRRMVMGAYSRKFDRVRKFRKKRIL